MNPWFTTMFKKKWTASLNSIEAERRYLQGQQAQGYCSASGLIAELDAKEEKLRKQMRAEWKSLVDEGRAQGPLPKCPVLAGLTDLTETLAK